MHLRVRQLITICSALSICTLVRADEVTRQVQEELRRRHLYFNEIDGRNNPDVTSALRQYQQRQGFAQTGTADDTTLRSLGILNEPSAPGESDTLPDVPVLRSDQALPPNRPAAPAAPLAESKHPITQAEAASFVRRYFDACESPSIFDELGFYADQVDYFDHGIVDRGYVQNELAAYDQRWPRRKYTLLNTVHVLRNGGRTTAKFRIAFEVANSVANRTARGRLDETFGLARRSDGTVDIVSLREERVRRVSTRRGPADPVVRSVRKVFRSIFHH